MGGGGETVSSRIWAAGLVRDTYKVQANLKGTDNTMLRSYDLKNSTTTSFQQSFWLQNIGQHYHQETTIMFRLI